MNTGFWFVFLSVVFVMFVPDAINDYMEKHGL